MPTSSSSAEETKPKARKKATRKTATKKTTTRRKKTKKVDDTPELFDEDSFGDGVDEAVEEPKPKKKAARKKAAKRTRKRKPAEDNLDEKAVSTEPIDDTSAVLEEARSARFDDDEGGADLSDLDDYFNGKDSASSGGSSKEKNSGDAEASDDKSEEGDRPRRRRRRRRRGKGDRNNNEQASGSNSGRGGGGGGGGGGRGRGGRRGGRDRGNDRGGRQSSNRRGGRQVQSGGEPIEGTFEGVLELHPKGYGFLRDPNKNYAAEDANPFVSSSVVEKYNLREGVLVKGEVGPGSRNQGPRLQEVELIDNFTPEEYEQIKNFDELTPINPFEQIKLETGPRPVTMRVMDLLCPIGKGQRALLVAPPRTGKTMLLQDIANSVAQNHPEVHLMVLLIDERPEEVTEMRRSVKGEVVASSLDNDVESHVRLAQLIIERGKRLAEEGQDVFILLDSITRLARAFNKWINPSGRTGRGGLDIKALDIPKKLFGTARRFDEGGSLTVCGTALIDTQNNMDEAIFQEFKGTGNMEMVLSRDLADRRIWPAIDITRSGTRREEKILSPETLEGVTMLRRSLISLTPVDAMEQLTRTLLKFETNDEFLRKIQAVL
ncbi:MAG: hypothetical protein Fues2KO_35160 [Fuerstiella sp.]